ncbi:protein Vhl-like [Teleopsis dalmanni]|uniref:protein Vhl-like n=1 Tax=Teleopsis dalmanni TaxID=139649 RepID=UPI0018CF7E6E|nr:protein Vhl-like [Teleopsis dalmanni]XP_037947168.1 protein Vhl-like [Teleopsis dalmanni]
MEEGRYRLRSGPSHIKCYVLFVNVTTRNVDILWIDPGGIEKLFASINPGKKVKVDTFQTHPWVFRDKDTGEYMQVDHKDVFWPTPCVKLLPNFPQGALNCRRAVNIHSPVRSLREICLWNILKNISSDILTLNNDSICALGLPVTLTNELLAKARSISLYKKL